MDSGPLKEYLKEKGATLVGVGDITIALTREIVHLNRGIALALNRGLNQYTIDKLVRLQRITEAWLKEKGFRSLSVPPDSDRKNGKCITRLFRLISHKTAATCSGLGWIGKNGLLINSDYGSKLSWATVLTDARFEADVPVTKSECGECELCVRHCPSGAVQGHLWSMNDPLQELVVYEKCRSLKKDRHIFDQKPNCGLCITICPYSRNDWKSGSEKEKVFDDSGRIQ
ncbi:MAG TPA: 4Fe-4S double cluster binding domain-containing protein [Dissulfurispiraceae bacterium]|nr:4Fe-4S double cluster binding domain-containing protein [Dissulfurispiraceae bacterium]